MKKVISISLALLMIAAMLHISVATHFCGGKEIASKVSFTGKLANCGMERSENQVPLPWTSLSQHCCENVVIICQTDNNYTPSFSFIPESCQYNFQIFAVPPGLTANSFADLIPLYTDVSPPGALMYTCVDLSEICVFRI
jgi:hypothetical protein